MSHYIFIKFPHTQTFFWKLLILPLGPSNWTVVDIRPCRLIKMLKVCDRHVRTTICCKNCICKEAGLIKLDLTRAHNNSYKHTLNIFQREYCIDWTKLQALKDYFVSDKCRTTFFFLGPPRTAGGSFQPSWGPKFRRGRERIRKKPAFFFCSHTQEAKDSQYNTISLSQG